MDTLHDSADAHPLVARAKVDRIYRNARRKFLAAAIVSLVLTCIVILPDRHGMLGIGSLFGFGVAAAASIVLTGRQFVVMDEASAERLTVYAQTEPAMRRLAEMASAWVAANDAEKARAAAADRWRVEELARQRQRVA